MKIYTKTGDTGKTSLFDGSRVEKSHPLVDIYGEIDELNSILGLAIGFVRDPNLANALTNHQRDLFALGAKLANPENKPQKEKADFTLEKVEALEQAIDVMQAILTPLTSFILPGGSSAAASLHMARCVCRRAERKLTGLAITHHLAPLAIQYLNRLSDYLFVAARFANHLQKQKDVLWS